MRDDRHVFALVVLALGWTALLGTAVLARADVFSGWAFWASLALGCLLFSALIAWSGTHIVAQLRAVTEAKRHEVGPPPGPSAPASWPIHGRRSSTTIRRRGEVARR